MDREQAIEIIERHIDNNIASGSFVEQALSMAIEALKAQLSKEGTTSAIPLSWIEKYIEWLKSFDNEFANLAAAHISVMVKKWRDEQHERTD